MTKKNVAIIVISAVSAILLCVLILFIIIPMAKFSNTQDAMLSISTPSGYYDKSLRVKIDVKSKLMPGAKIYYTIDGTDPDPKTRVMYEDDKEIKIKSTCSEYDGSSIRLQQIQNKTNVYVVKAKVKYLWMSSEVESQTYIVGDSIDETFGVKVISITSDFENLYDYNTGIFVKGAVYDENEDNPAKGLILGNYNMRTDEWIKKSHITMIDTDGETILDQNIGLGVSGWTSALNDVKSLKIVADEIYDAKNPKLKLSLYNEKFSELSQFSLTKNMRLRSGSQDVAQGANIRSAVIDDLAKESNFDGRAGTDRVVVYINGEYYGIFDMQYTYSDTYLKNRYSLPDSDFIEKYKGSEQLCFDSMKVEKYFDLDLNNEQNREILEQYVDVDNYLLYYAICILANNTDWPDNNFESWRYIGGYDGVNKYTDGRCRFLIYDVDLIFNLPDSPAFFGGSNEDTFVSVMENINRGVGSQLSKLMKSDYYKNKFITVISDLLNTSFKAENINSIIDKEYEKIAKAYTKFESKTAERNKGFLVQMHNAANMREQQVRADLNKFFNCSKTYEFTISVGNGTQVNWNNMNFYAGNKYSNVYYKGVSFTITAESYPSYKFTGFTVNGKLYKENELTVTDDMIKDGKINIEVLSEKTKGESLVFKEVHYDDNGTWLKVQNIGTTDIDLSKYFISDTETRLKAYNLPKVTLKPGDVYVIEGRNLDKANKCEFKFERDETFYLSDGESIYDTLLVKRMGENETYCRYLDSNTFVFLENTPDRKTAK